MSEKIKRCIVHGYELSYSSDWTGSLEPLHHWIYYWNQASLAWDYIAKDMPIIEIGIGTGFLKNYLKSQGWKCSTIDIDEAKRPDIVSDIASGDLSSMDFECVLAFEIFEHLPYPLFKQAVYNLTQYRPKFIIFSIPWSERRILELKINIPRLKEKTLSFYARKNRILAQNHFWELKKHGKDSDSILSQGKKGLVSIAKIRELFSFVGYELTIKQKVKNIQYFVAERR